MKKALKEIQDGTFAKDWLLENRSAGRAHFLAERRIHAETQLEEVGKKLRSMMSWLQAPKAAAPAPAPAKKAPAKKAPAKKAPAKKAPVKKAAVKKAPAKKAPVKK